MTRMHAASGMEIFRCAIRGADLQCSAATAPIVRFQATEPVHQSPPAHPATLNQFPSSTSFRLVVLFFLAINSCFD